MKAKDGNLFYGSGFLPPHHLLPGKLIVLEGTDGVGRSTQIQLRTGWRPKDARIMACGAPR